MFTNNTVSFTFTDIFPQAIQMLGVKSMSISQLRAALEMTYRRFDLLDARVGGAGGVHGAIRDQWASMGWERSFLR
jgi:hypothetical protein